MGSPVEPGHGNHAEAHLPAGRGRNSRPRRKIEVPAFSVFSMARKAPSQRSRSLPCAGARRCRSSGSRESALWRPSSAHPMHRDQQRFFAFSRSPHRPSSIGRATTPRRSPANAAQPAGRNPARSVTTVDVALSRRRYGPISQRPMPLRTPGRSRSIWPVLRRRRIAHSMISVSGSSRRCRCTTK